MSTGRSASRSWGRGIAVLLALAVVALLAWLILHSSGSLGRGGLQTRPVLAAATGPAAEPEPEQREKIGHANVNVHVHVKEGTVVPADRYAGMYAGPGPDDPAGPGMLPHPITAEHLRIYRDVELLDGAWQALKRKEFMLARSLLREHAQEYASHYDDLNDGLTILADCMERPTAATRDRAQRFYDQHTASTARRRIRRHCLEAVPSS